MVKMCIQNHILKNYLFIYFKNHLFLAFAYHSYSVYFQFIILKKFVARNYIFYSSQLHWLTKEFQLYVVIKL